MTKTEVVRLMKSSQTEREWNANCDKVKAAFNSKYPKFWYTAIIEGGVLMEASVRFA